MGRRVRLRKDTDDESQFWCGGGTSTVREEVWVNAKGQVVRYNLAFLLPHLFHFDNGRVLGFDNAHGVHERHFMGKVTPVVFKAARFYAEVQEFRRGYEE